MCGRISYLYFFSLWNFSRFFYTHVTFCLLSLLHYSCILSIYPSCVMILVPWDISCWSDSGLLKHTTSAWHIFWAYWGDHRTSKHRHPQLSVERGETRAYKKISAHTRLFFLSLWLLPNYFLLLWIWQSLVNMESSSDHSDLSICGSWFFSYYYYFKKTPVQATLHNLALLSQDLGSS